MPNTLGLDDDLDGVVLIEEIEKAFGVAFSDVDTVRWSTVGDVFADLERRFRFEAGVGGQCATSMAFFRLRRSLRDLGVQGRLRPETAFADVTGLAPRRLMKDLESRSGFRLPATTANSWAVGCFLLLFIGLLASVFVGTSGLTLGLLAATSSTLLFLIAVDRGTLPDDCKTLGGLARRAATLNYAQLVGHGAGVRDGELWRVFCDLLAQHTPLPKTEIERETLLLQKQLKSR